MVVLFWILFGISVLLYLLVNLFIFIILDRDEDASILYISPLVYVFSAFIFITSIGLFAPNTAGAIWIVANSIGLIVHIIFMVKFREHIGIERLMFLPALLLAPIPFFVNPKISPYRIGNNFFEQFNGLPSIIITVWLPLLFICVIVVLVNAFLTRRRQLLPVDRRDYNDYSGDRDYLRFRDFEDKTTRILHEDMQSFKYRLDDLLKRQAELIHTFSIDKSSRSQQNISVKQVDNKQLNELLKLVLELKDKFERSDSSSKPRYANTSNQIFIKELYHFLITPLSQIEVKTIIFDQYKNDIPSQLQKAVETIRISIDICKSVLAAYRELAYVSSSSDWSPESLQESVIAAANLYQESLGTNITLSVTLDDNYPPYTNNYLIAIILPLLENAIKASPPGEVVSITIGSFDSEIVLKMTNRSKTLRTTEELNREGFSTKPDHKGTGLLIARHLVEEQNNGTFTAEVSNGIVSIIIKLPSKK